MRSNKKRKHNFDCFLIIWLSRIMEKTTTALTTSTMFTDSTRWWRHRGRDRTEWGGGGREGCRMEERRRSGCFALSKLFSALWKFYCLWKCFIYGSRWSDRHCRHCRRRQCVRWKKHLTFYTSCRCCHWYCCCCCHPEPCMYGWTSTTTDRAVPCLNM